MMKKIIAFFGVCLCAMLSCEESPNEPQTTQTQEKSKLTIIVEDRNNNPIANAYVTCAGPVTPANESSKDTDANGRVGFRLLISQGTISVGYTIIKKGYTNVNGSTNVKKGQNKSITVTMGGGSSSSGDLIADDILVFTTNPYEEISKKNGDNKIEIPQSGKFAELWFKAKGASDYGMTQYSNKFLFDGDEIKLQTNFTGTYKTNVTLSAGSHTAKFILDIADEAREKDETNNQLTFTFEAVVK